MAGETSAAQTPLIPPPTECRPPLHPLCHPVASPSCPPLCSLSAPLPRHHPLPDYPLTPPPTATPLAPPAGTPLRSRSPPLAPSPPSATSTTIVSSSAKSPRSSALASVVSSSRCTARFTGLRGEGGQKEESCGEAEGAAVPRPECRWSPARALNCARHGPAGEGDKESAVGEVGGGQRLGQCGLQLALNREPVRRGGASSRQ